MENKFAKYRGCIVFSKLGTCLLVLLITAAGCLGEASDSETGSINQIDPAEQQDHEHQYPNQEESQIKDTILSSSELGSSNTDQKEVKDETNLNNQDTEHIVDPIQQEMKTNSDPPVEDKQILKEKENAEPIIISETTEDNKYAEKYAQNQSKSIDNAENTEMQETLVRDVEKSEQIQTDTHQIVTPDEVYDSDKSESNVLAQEIESIVANNETESGNNSSIFQWIKYFIDPFLEEFKDGIYSKASEKSNLSESNNSDVNSNETLDFSALNITEPDFLNLTETDSVNTTDSGKKVKFQCVGRNVTDNSNATVKLITSARLLQFLSFDKNETENVTDCLLVMFYAPWCHFCAETAPNYNALARAYPQLDFVAVDTAQFSNLLARFGTVSVPNILVFHQSRAAVKFNQTERTFENFVSFVKNTTGLEPNVTVNVTEADHFGPVPSVPTDDPDFLLLISWIFVIFCSMCMFVKSTKGQQWINKVCILWQEHQHID